MRLIYNGAGSGSSAIKHSIYDIFCALERNFGKERSPALLSQIKRFLREIHGAADADIEDAFQRRKLECAAMLPALLDSVKLNPSQFFRQLCCPRTGPLQFCREALLDTIKEFHKSRPFVSDAEELNAYFAKYCGTEGPLSSLFTPLFLFLFFFFFSHLVFPLLTTEYPMQRFLQVNYPTQVRNHRSIRVRRTQNQSTSAKAECTDQMLSALLLPLQRLSQSALHQSLLRTATHVPRSELTR
jgi:hypothetical protein